MKKPNDLKEVSLGKFGLETVKSAASRLKMTPGAVLKWITTGQIEAVPVRNGNDIAVYLLEIEKVDKFKRPKRGRPVLDA